MTVILGGGESGIGAALLAHKLSMPVFLSDAGKLKEEFKNHLIEKEIDFEEEGHSIVYDFTPHLVIKSPGIPDKAEIIKYYYNLGVEVISEIEFAYRHCTGKIIAITGSNGKTTTTNLLYHILHTAGLDVVKVGNVGYSFARSVAEKNHKYYVIEVSSFQLDSVVNFKPYIAILLNITPDHLDRYEYKFENYIRSKFRITLNQDAQDHLILYKDEVIIQNYSSMNISSNIHWMESSLTSHEELVINGNTNHHFRNSVLKGRHNAMNTACAVEACSILGISTDQIQTGIDTFRNDPHRLESIALINGVEYINDSKATNVDSVFWALDAMKKKIVWIAGGQDKGNDYSTILELVKAKVKVLVALGKDNSKLIEFFGPYVKVIDTNSVSTCLEQCQKFAENGDVVLLSPACASFDLFQNYQHRGDEFRKEVLSLNQKN